MQIRPSGFGPRTFVSFWIAIFPPSLDNIFLWKIVVIKFSQKNFWEHFLMNFNYFFCYEWDLMQYLQVHNERVKQQVILSNHPHHQQIHQQTPVIMTTATTTTTVSQPPAPVKVQSSSKSKSSRKNTNSESSTGRGTPSKNRFKCLHVAIILQKCFLLKWSRLLNDYAML